LPCVQARAATPVAADLVGRDAERGAVDPCHGIPQLFSPRERPRERLGGRLFGHVDPPTGEREHRPVDAVTFGSEQRIEIVRLDRCRQLVLREHHARSSCLSILVHG
jgi:hypothetical protein